MPAGGAEAERLQPLLRNLGRVDLREPEGLHASRAKLREQLFQMGSTRDRDDKAAGVVKTRSPMSSLRQKRYALIPRTHCVP
jgi:hypothetical protein